MAEQPEQHAVATYGLTKVFRDFWMRPRVTAVDGLDMQVRPHEVYGLLGPNGSGKSTTIKIILGLLFPTRGRVSVFGKLPTEVAVKRRIGYLPEESYLYKFLNARETLDYYGRLFGLAGATRRQRTDMLLEMVGLDAVQRRPVGEFSKGMQRRIGLAQALINDPDLLILDEPTAGLDPIGTRQIKDLILELKRRGKTVLLSSHLLADVEDVCDRVSILYGGRKRAEGTVDQLLTDAGSTRIETPTLQPETITKIEQLIEREEGKAIERVAAPRQRLETLFLGIVERARSEGAATSGVRGGGGVADFLARDAHMPESTSGADLIDSLVGGGERHENEPAEAEPAEAPGGESEPAREVIDELTGPSDDEPDRGESAAEPMEPAPEEGEPQREQPDRSVIDELTGGDERNNQ